MKSYFIYFVLVTCGVLGTPLLSVSNSTPVKTVASDQSQSQYNILSLDGAGLNNIISAYIMSQIEEYAFNKTENLNAPRNTEKKIVATKDLFDMISALSVSSFLAAGVSIPSPDNYEEPAYSSKDLLKLYNMKRNDINEFYHYTPPQGIIIVLLLGIIGLICFNIGAYYFDNSDIQKAHIVIELYINHAINTKLDKRSGRLSLDLVEKATITPNERTDKVKIRKALYRKKQEYNNCRILKDFNRWSMSSKIGSGQEVTEALNEQHFTEESAFKNFKKFNPKKYILDKGELILQDRYFDFIRLPGQGQSIDNDLLEHLLDKKRNQILESCLKFVHNGAQIQGQIEIDSLQSLRDSTKDSASLLFIKSHNQYQQLKPMKWFITFFGIFMTWILYMWLLFLIDSEFGLFYQIGNLMGNKAHTQNVVYFEQRNEIVTFMEDIYSHSSFNDLLVDELLISSFEFNSKSPRYFSQYFKKQIEEDQGGSELTIQEAISAAISSPQYFNPFTVGDDQMYLDMNIFQAKNPSFDSYMIAKNLLGKENIRILSISPNSLKTNISYEPVNNSAYGFHVNGLDMHTEQWMDTSQPQSIFVDYTLNKTLKSSDYLRLSSIRPNLDTYVSNTEALKQGQELYQQNQKEIEQFLDKIIERKWGKTK